MLVWKKSLLYTTTFSLALVLGLVTIHQQLTLAESTPISAATTETRVFDPPDEGANPTTTGGGTRGGSCTPRGKSIIPLMPTKNSVLTVSGYPTLFAYIPESTSQTVRFVLREVVGDEAQDEPVYETTFKIPTTPAIVSVALPNAALPPLKVGKTYHWFLVLVCDTEDGSKNALADGWIKRIEPSPTLANELGKTSRRDMWRVYGQAGIWQETLATLAQLRRSSPTDPKLAADWEKLLSEVELSAVAKAPLLDCCTVHN